MAADLETTWNGEKTVPSDLPGDEREGTAPTQHRVFFAATDRRKPPLTCTWNAPGKNLERSAARSGQRPARAREPVDYGVRPAGSKIDLERDLEPGSR
jgi:hypothetical protein